MHEEESPGRAFNYGTSTGTSLLVCNSVPFMQAPMSTVLTGII